jgi:hypothetical protein
VTGKSQVNVSPKATPPLESRVSNGKAGAVQPLSPKRAFRVGEVGTSVTNGVTKAGSCSLRMSTPG